MTKLSATYVIVVYANQIFLIRDLRQS